MRHRYERTTTMRHSLFRESLVCALIACWPAAARAAENTERLERKWQPRMVLQYQGYNQVHIPAKQQNLVNPQSWGHHFIYMPDKNRLLLQTGHWQLSSDDLGVTWTRRIAKPRRYFTYLGDGKVLARAWEDEKRLISEDYGDTWRPLAPLAPLPGKTPVFSMGPDLVDRDPATGKVVRLAESVLRQFRCSFDGGLTWPESVATPWCEETVMVRAGNGDIVAATRTGNDHGYIEVHGTNMPDAEKTPYDMWLVGGGFDFYCGFGVHISKDNGKTWSPIKQLFMHGRFHASPVLMPNNDLVMSYVVRKGYDNTPEGLPQYAIEAVISRDNGQTWNLNHRYVLDKWQGEWENKPGGKVKLMAPNECYTVLLNDGSLMTSFERGVQESDGKYYRMLKLVHWRLDKEKK